MRRTNLDWLSVLNPRLGWTPKFATAACFRRIRVEAEALAIEFAVHHGVPWQKVEVLYR